MAGERRLQTLPGLSSFGMAVEYHSRQGKGMSLSFGMAFEHRLQACHTSGATKDQPCSPPCGTAV